VQTVSVQVCPSAGCYGFAPLFAINGIVAVTLGFYFDNDALAIGAADDEVRRVSMPALIFAAISR